MEMSEQVDQLAVALSQAQAEMDFAKKDSENPFFKSSYADLASVWDVCRKVLPKNDIAVVQTMVPGEGVNVCTTLLHKSGQWIRGTCSLPPVKVDPQAYGSAITYARRYSLAAIAGVIADDDDAEGAMQRDKKKQAPPAKPAAPQKLEPATKPQLQKISILAGELGCADREAKLARINKWLASKGAKPVTSSTELTKDDASALIEAMEQARKAA